MNRLHKLKTGGILSIIDQLVVSVSNFLTGVVIAKSVSPEQFGIYSLLWAGLMVLSGVQNSFITGPTRVLGVRKKGENNNGHMNTQVMLQLVLGAVLSLTAAAIILFVDGISFSLLVVFPLCIFFVQLQELVRVINLTNLHIASLLRLDIITHALRLTILFGLVFYGKLNPETALIAILLASAVGAAIYLNGYSFACQNVEKMILATRENWSFGRWLILESVAYSASTQLYFYLTALWVDIQSVAALSGVQNILNIVNILFVGLVGFVTPIARRKILEEDYVGWRGLLITTSWVLVVTSVAVWLLISLFAEGILAVLYKPFYSGYAYLVWILGAGLLLRALNSMLIVAFRTAGLPQVGFYAQIASAIVTLALAYPLIVYLGTAGAAIGLVLTQALWLIVYLYNIKNGKLSSLKLLQKRDL